MYVLEFLLLILPTPENIVIMISNGNIYDVRPTGQAKRRMLRTRIKCSTKHQSILARNSLHSQHLAALKKRIEI